MTSSYTTSKNLEKPASGDYSGAWAGPLNANFDIIEKALAGTQSYTLGSANVTCTQSELQNARLKVTGTLTANVALQIPNGISGDWLISNATSGGFSLTVRQASGDTGVTVTQGKNAFIFSDGTNCLPTVDVGGVDLSAYAQKASNLSDLTNAGTARTNLGLGSAATATAGTGANNVLLLDGSGNANVSAAVNDSKGNVRGIPQNAQGGAYTLAASDAGKHISITTGGVTIPSGTMSVNDAVTIYNNSGSSQTITQGTSVTLRQAGTANTGNRTLAQYGLCTILCVAANTFVISGAGLS